MSTNSNNVNGYNKTDPEALSSALLKQSEIISPPSVGSSTLPLEAQERKGSSELSRAPASQEGEDDLSPTLPANQASSLDSCNIEDPIIIEVLDEKKGETKKF